ncbi:tRNA dihydrouridine(20/20a) synthase DusA [Rhodovulum sp. DZ06]|uniref:tRNA dihydrouridine(20/20a) synthase DusA n=1 Tax=Rhodovulum sp. DZ06 TaxID=3425126 RepID=UPI003D32D80D
MHDAPKAGDPRPTHLLSVAPMMDWTDRHCRALHRTLSACTLLYTEMVTAPALTHAEDWQLKKMLDFSGPEHPVALQIGGSDPAELAEAVRIACAWGYDEINLNVGCPSDRVQNGAFGAVLMKDPDLVARCCAAMMEASAAAGGPEITVKCRIGVDDQDPQAVLPDFLDRVAAVGVRRFAVHARMAWLKGLSPKENRDVPPLNYPLVHAMKARRPDLSISINGGIQTLDAALEEIGGGAGEGGAAGVPLDGAMIGRAAYHAPDLVLGSADRRVFGLDVPDVTPEQAVARYMPYVEEMLAAGVPLHRITKHMLGLFTGRPGARKWRRVLTEESRLEGAGTEVIVKAQACVAPAD